MFTDAEAMMMMTANQNIGEAQNTIDQLDDEITRLRALVRDLSASAQAWKARSMEMETARDQALDIAAAARAAVPADVRAAQRREWLASL